MPYRDPMGYCDVKFPDLGFEVLISKLKPEHFLKKPSILAEKTMNVLNNTGFLMTCLSFRFQPFPATTMTFSERPRLLSFMVISLTSRPLPRRKNVGGGAVGPTLPPISGLPIAPGTLIHSSKKAARWFFVDDSPKSKHLCTFAGHQAMADSKEW